MKLTQKLLTAGSLALLVSLSACDNDDEKGSGQVSKNDAKAKIASFNGSATSDLQDLANADGVEAMQDFFNLVETDDPFGRIGTDKNKVRAFLRDKGREFRAVFVPASGINGRTNADEPFDFDDNTGVYAWNSTEEIFEKKSESDVIEIQFPTEGSESNNATIEITAYDEILVEDEWEGEYYEPSRIVANLFVNDQKKASLDLDIDYDINGFPQAAEIEVMVTPFTASVSFDVTASTSSTLSFNLSEGQTTLIATSVTVKYSDSSKSEESVSSLDGFVQFKNMKIKGSVDAEGADTENPDLNDFVKLAVYADDEKLGDIVFVTENQQEIPYVQYADGSKEKLETVFQPVVDELEDLSESLGSNG